MKAAPHWEKIGGQVPHHGICLALSSLRSKTSCGIGEFLDLLPLIDWCKSVFFDCIQLLPLNDSGKDPSPYNPLSSCALDPIYLSLSELGIDVTAFRELNSLEETCRSSVLTKKMEALYELFQKTFASVCKTKEYQTFLKENKSWLEPYAFFKACKEKFLHRHFLEFPKAPKPSQEKIDFFSFLQFHCFSQLEKVKAHADAKGLLLQGDIPILISPDSADVFQEPSLFHLELEAGAPPDDYNPLGQKWGFPLFNWDEIEKQQFSWWKRRLKIAERFFHLYRIDHVVGFFRIWGIEKGKKPMEGSFFPENPVLWEPQGKKLLEMMLEATTMLPIAEDLGTIPPFVYPLLKKLGICGTKVIRWQKKDFQSFIPFSMYEPFSVTTLSTPDMDPLELWWKKYPAESVPFAHFKNWPFHPLLSRKQRFELLKDAHHTPSYFHINLLQEYLALFPDLVWPDPEKERINVPGTLLPTNWTYRFRPLLEELTTHEELALAIRAAIE
jgi:4-alpha-glucanotransferase